MEKAIATLWEETLSDLQSEVGDARYDAWMKNTVAVSMGDGVLSVGVPTTFIADWLDRHYIDCMTAAVARRLGEPLKLKLVVDGALFRNNRRREKEVKEAILEEVAPSHGARLQKERYNLDNFVVGPCNSIAYAAARKVTQAPGSVYSPLFIHGGVGLGKTHLLVGIANALAAGRFRGPVEYVSAEGFTNRFLFALHNGSLDAFRSRYRRAKLLVIDDVHFLAHKPATQGEFLHTFNTLSRNGCQIVMASDSHPKLIGKLQETLVNRFVSGMVAKLDKPGYETRLEIVRRKAAERHLDLTDEVADFVALHAQANVREIEGAVNTLAAFESISPSRVDIRLAARALKGLVESGSRPVSLPDIDSAVTTYMGLAEGDLRGRRRTQPISHARHMAMYLARRLGSFSYSEIGAYFGKRNHSSVVSAVDKMKRLCSSDANLAGTVAALESEFGL